LFNIPEVDGLYVVEFKKSGFINTKFDIEIAAGTMFANWFSISPALDLGKMRIVLDWGKKPRDLDLHLNKMGSYHISYRRMRAPSERDYKFSTDGSAHLDRDDTNGYGPETITIDEFDVGGSYQIYVEDYSNRKSKKSKSLSNSHAVLRLYGGNNELLNTYHVPPNQRGSYWNVLSIESSRLVKKESVMIVSPPMN
jgi:hypothetical protein